MAALLFSEQYVEAYLGPCQVSMMELLAKTAANCFLQITW